MKQTLIDFYLDYVNNFITVKGLAAYYGLDLTDATVLIELGKKYHEARLNRTYIIN